MFGDLPVVLLLISSLTVSWLENTWLNLDAQICWALFSSPGHSLPWCMVQGHLQRNWILLQGKCLRNVNGVLLVDNTVEIFSGHAGSRWSCSAAAGRDAEPRDESLGPTSARRSVHLPPCLAILSFAGHAFRAAVSSWHTDPSSLHNVRLP